MKSFLLPLIVLAGSLGSVGSVGGVGGVEDESEFGSKTAYKMSFDVDEEHVLENTTAYELLLPDCRLTQIQILVRHGTQAPDSRTATTIANLQKTLKRLGARNAADYVNPFTVTDQLSDAGKDELRQMGGRFSHRYAALFDSWKNKTGTRNASIYDTNKSETKDSATAFLCGIDPDIPAQDWNAQEDNDALRSFDRCPAYDQLSYRSDFNKEYTSFLRSTFFQDATSQVLSNMGLDPTAALSSDDVMDIYRFCGLLLANSNAASDSWCNALDGVDLSVLEYAADLEAYYHYSYGNTINTKMACPFMTNTLANLQLSKHRAPAAHEVVLSFGHEQTVLSVLSSMAMFKDSVPLTADHFVALRESREFKTSRIAPFAANVAILLWDCLRGQFVQVMVNERLNSETLCALDAPCEYGYFMEKLNALVDCDFADICKASPSRQVSGTRRHRGGVILTGMMAIVMLVLDCLFMA